MAWVKTTFKDSPKLPINTQLYNICLPAMKKGQMYGEKIITSEGVTLGFDSSSPSFTIIKNRAERDYKMIFNHRLNDYLTADFCTQPDFMFELILDTTETLKPILDTTGNRNITVVNSNDQIIQYDKHQMFSFIDSISEYIRVKEILIYDIESKQKIKLIDYLLNDWITLLPQNILEQAEFYAELERVKLDAGERFRYVGNWHINRYSGFILDIVTEWIQGWQRSLDVFRKNYNTLALLNLREIFFNPDDYIIAHLPDNYDSNYWFKAVFFKNKEVLYKLCRILGQGYIPFTTNKSDITDKHPNDWDSNWQDVPSGGTGGGGTYPPEGGGQPGSGVGGGDGNNDNTSDIIGLPPIPTLGASTSGMVTIFNPELDELKNLASYLWKPDFIEAISKLLQDPIEGLIGLNMFPVLPMRADVKSDVKVGFVNTNVKMFKVPQQFVKVSCGSLKIGNYWGNFMDYSPYTKAQLYLPFIGFIDVSVDEFMGGELFIDYYVDLMTGVCQCFVRCKNTNKLTKSPYDAILYTFTGNCATQIPITSANYNSIIQSAAIGIGTVAVGAATGGTGALATAGSSGALATAGTVTKGVAMGALETLPGATANAVMGSKISLTRSGGISASGALMSYKKPYIVITRPSQSRPDNYNKLIGVPSNITAKLGDLKGYTQVSSVQLSNINCLGDERIEIENLLKSGVIL